MLWIKVIMKRVIVDHIIILLSSFFFKVFLNIDDTIIDFEWIYNYLHILCLQQAEKHHCLSSGNSDDRFVAKNGICSVVPVQIKHHR